MMLVVDPRSATPPFEQVKQQLLAQMRSGELAAGTKLPTVRRLADDLGLAPNTVARCYRELERDGVIETRGRNGSYVSLSDDTAERGAYEAAQSFAQRIRALGVDAERALDLARAALQ